MATNRDTACLRCFVQRKTNTPHEVVVILDKTSGTICTLFFICLGLVHMQKWNWARLLLESGVVDPGGVYLYPDHVTHIIVTQKRCAHKKQSNRQEKNWIQIRSQKTIRILPPISDIIKFTLYFIYILGILKKRSRIMKKCRLEICTVTNPESWILNIYV